MAYSDLSYSKIGWKNRSEALTTPLGKTNLNKMDDMIYNLVIQLREAYNELNRSKANSADFTGSVVSGVDYNSTTGKFTFSFFGSQQKYVVNLNLDKLPIDFSMDANGVITMVTQGGDRYTADISQLIPTFDFQASDMIEFSVETTGKNSVVKAYLKQNSITDQYMQPNYLADITTQAGIATAQAQLASGYANDAAFDADLAKSYSIGDETTRAGSSTDNAKYYMEQTEALKTDVEGLKSDTQDILTGAQTIQTTILISEANAKESEQNALTSEENAETYKNQTESQVAIAESYATGNETARTGSDTDNAKYYKEQTERIKSDTQDIKEQTETYVENAKTEISGYADDAKESELSAKQYYDDTKEIADNLNDTIDSSIVKRLEKMNFSLNNRGHLILEFEQ